MIEDFVNWFSGDFVLTFIAVLIVLLISVVIVSIPSILGYLLDERARKLNREYEEWNYKRNKVKIHSEVKKEKIIATAKKYLIQIKQEYPWWKRLSPLYLMKKKNLKMIIKVAKMR